jgi:hypothetical protein
MPGRYELALADSKKSEPATGAEPVFIGARPKTAEALIFRARRNTN